MEMLFLLALPLVAMALGSGQHGEDIAGTDGDDLLDGTGHSDRISGGDGDDLLQGHGSRDLIYGGAGDDAVRGGAGDDVIYLDEGDDLAIDFSWDNDVVYFEHNYAADNDLIYGGAGADIISDSNGSDTIYGGTGTDVIATIDAYGRDDAPDQISGGWGFDSLAGDDGDTLTGDQGNDSFHIWIDETSDRPVTVTDFDGDFDTLTLVFDTHYLAASDYNGFSSQTDAESGDVTVFAAGRAVAILTNPHNFELSHVQAYADDSANQDDEPIELELQITPAGAAASETLASTNASDLIAATSGNDLLSGLGGSDTIYGGAGNDEVRGGAGNDLIYLGEGDDLSTDFYLDENDQLQYAPEVSADDDTIYGGAGDDVIVDSQGSNAIYGGTGKDTLWTFDAFGSDDAPDQSIGGWGFDTLFGDDADTLTGDQGNDSFNIVIDETTDRAVTITDFDGDHDTLTLNFDTHYLATSDYTGLTTQTDAANGNVTVFAAGRAVVVMISPSNFNPSRVELYAADSDGWT